MKLSEISRNFKNVISWDHSLMSFSLATDGRSSLKLFSVAR